MWRINTKGLPFLRLLTSKTPITHRNYAVYHVNKTSPQNSSHEQTRVNPIVEYKKGQCFQHPHYSRGTCNIENCINKNCSTPCSKITAEAHVVVATHDG